jgi:hypothetical protein
MIPAVFALWRRWRIPWFSQYSHNGGGGNNHDSRNRHLLAAAALIMVAAIVFNDYAIT